MHRGWGSHYFLGLYVAEDAVPEGEAGLDGGFGGGGGLLPESLVVSTEVFDHPEGEGAVVFAVDFDVAFQVPDELGEVAGAGVEVADEGAEDPGDGVFAAEGEGGGDGWEAAGVDGVEGALDEGAGGGWGVDKLERGGGEGVANGSGVGSELFHGLEVELEVAGGATLEDVGLFAEDDFIDEAAAVGEGGGDPG